MILFMKLDQVKINLNNMIILQVRSAINVVNLCLKLKEKVLKCLGALI